jgi:glutathione S-transferase
MVTIHHLEHSRSQRIIWLCQELGLDYRVVSYKRDPVTSLAPIELEEIHPLGKSPVITDGKKTVIESGAIIDYLLRKYGDGRLMPKPDTQEYDQYQQWLHYGESGAILPLMLKLYTSKLPEGTGQLQPRIDSELARHLSYLEGALNDVDWFVGNEFSGADIQLSFIAEIAPILYSLDDYPNLAAFRDRCHNREAYRYVLASNDFYAYGPR